MRRPFHGVTLGIVPAVNQGGSAPESRNMQNRRARERSARMSKVCASLAWFFGQLAWMGSGRLDRPDLPDTLAPRPEPSFVEVTGWTVASRTNAVTRAQQALLAPDMARSPGRFDGHTPLIVNDHANAQGHYANFRAQGAGGCGRMRAGRTEQRDGKPSFVRDRNANASAGLKEPSRDEAHRPDYARLVASALAFAEVAPPIVARALDKAQGDRERAAEKVRRVVETRANRA
jgi:hypothetical protein